MTQAAPRVSSEHLPADVFGLSNLARAALAEGPGFGPLPVVTRAADLPRPTEHLGAEERQVLGARVRAGYGQAGIELDPGSPTERSLNALTREGVFCVMTGQQPGFLASPLYSLYKALQACRVAKELEALWGTPVVPVFWNHADDHDVAEVHHAWQLNRNLDLQKVVLAGLSSGRVAVGELPITNERQHLGALRAQLHNIVEEHRFADLALDLFLPRDGETLPRALTRAFHRLLEPYGLLVAEPEWIRDLLSSEMGRIVSSSSLVTSLRAGEEELQHLGLPVAIPVGEATTGGAEDATAAALIYRHVAPEGHGGRERVALRAGGEGFRQDGVPGSRTSAELGSQIVTSPDEWSAGAVVRPLVQDAVFPTCAYVGGLGELSYHAQLGPAREAAGQPRTPFIPRVSMTLVDGDTRYALGRAEATVEAVLRARGKFRPSHQDEADEPEIAALLRTFAEETAAGLLKYKPGVAALEPALAITLKKTAGHVEQSIGKVIAKAIRVHQNSRGKGERQLRRINHTLFPRDVPQERLLGPFQFVARFGEAFVQLLWKEIPFASTEHIVLHIEEPPEAAQP